MYNLKENQLLITSNLYWNMDCFELEDDILKKENMKYYYRDAITFIPLFLCENDDEILLLTEMRAIDEMVDRLNINTEEYLEKKPNCIRDGFKTLIYF